MTYTFVALPVSRQTYTEIRQKLEAADYHHALVRGPGDRGVALDMHGIALVLDEKEGSA